MAIRIDVEGYCQECLDFSPDVIKAQRIGNSDGVFKHTDTIVQCEHARRCAAIHRYLEQKLKGGASG